MKIFFPTAILVASLVLSRAEMKEPIPLWPKGAPDMLGTNTWDVPTVTPYLPDPTNVTGATMVICPGGGYANLAAHEGRDYAIWLNQQGITCFVLKYRLGSHNYRYPVEFEDVTRAVRWVRAHANDYQIDPHRVGIMGSSAGGHLASTLLTHFDSGNPMAEDFIDQQSSRPDIGILCYAVITMGEYTHKGSLENLLGKNPPANLVKLLSNQLQVTSNTPPCFLWCTYEDTVVPMENTMMFAGALREHNIPFALHVYEKGGHGMGLHDKPPFKSPHPWANDCLFWLKARGFIK